MSTEQLQILLDAFGNATEGAYIIGILWVLKGYFFFLFGMCVVLYTIRTIAKLVRNVTLSVQLGNLIGRDPRIGSDAKEIERVFKAGMEATKF